MRKRDETVAAAFGARLRELMAGKGKVSPTARSGVDVAALAAGAGLTYEMARRYAEGRAVPRPDTLQRIAAWLGVSAGALAYGPDAGEGIQMETLQKCVQAMIAAQRTANVEMAPDRAAALVVMLYQEAVDGRFPPEATVLRMVRAMA